MSSFPFFNFELLLIVSTEFDFNWESVQAMITLYAVVLLEVNSVRKLKIFVNFEILFLHSLENTNNKFISVRHL